MTAQSLSAVRVKILAGASEKVVMGLGGGCHRYSSFLPLASKQS